jgi:hypothetical protein
LHPNGSVGLVLREFHTHHLGEVCDVRHDFYVLGVECDSP